MIDYEIRFNRNDWKTIELLRELGLSGTQLADGVINFADLSLWDIRRLEPLARSGNEHESRPPQSIKNAFVSATDGSIACEDHGENTTCYDILTPTEVSRFNDNPHRQLMIDILKGPSVYEAGRIFSNLVGYPFVDYDIAGADKPYASYQHLPTASLKGIHFTEGHVPDKISKWGKSVLQVVDTSAPPLFDESGNNVLYIKKESSFGSCVVTSPDGIITSAYHVFYDDKGSFKPLSIRHPNGQLFQVEENDILAKDVAHDLIQLKLPAFANLPHLQVRPPQGDTNKPTTVWVIGYPPSFMPKEQNSRFFTVGTLTLLDPRQKKLTVNAGAKPGYSGGAIIDQEGNLLGISSKVEGRSNAINKIFGTMHVNTTIGFIP